MALSFSPLYKRGVMIMTDYEMLALVLLIITLAFAIHNANHRDK